MARRAYTAAPPPFQLGTEAAEVECFRNSVANMIYNEALALACNSVHVNGLPEHIPQWFVMRTLFERGQVALFGDFSTGNYNAYACGGGGGIDIYGRPLTYLLTPKSGQAFRVGAKSEMLCVARANATRFPLADAISFAANRIADVEVAIACNLISSQSTDIIEVDDEKRAMSIKTAMRQKQAGQPAVYASPDVAQAMTRGTSATKIGTAFFADRLAELRQMYKQELFAQIGTLTANKYKRERVQSSEVNAGVGEVLDFIYMAIDQFNADAEKIGLEMVVNSTIADLYTTEEEAANV